VARVLASDARPGAEAAEFALAGGK
jgi:hypothetical protein